MSILDRLFSSPPAWDLDALPVPWGNPERPSIFAHIQAHLSDGGATLNEAGQTLPDEDLVRVALGMPWVAGGLDGAFGHHFGGGDTTDAVDRVMRGLRDLLQSAENERFEALYGKLVAQSTIDYVDPLLEAVAEEGVNAERLYAVARYLAERSPDREPVKVGMALLGLFAQPEDRPLLVTLGRHEEFTLYAAVAISGSGEDAGEVLWDLARSVHGWGRIQVIERLQETQDERIRAWLLREGCRNDVMDEYTALVCARVGGLSAALEAGEVDEALLDGAGVILSALIRGRRGPADGIGEYADGAAATLGYLEHLQRREGSLSHVVAVATIRDFLEEEEGEVADEALGWPARRDELRRMATGFLERPVWRERVEAELAEEDAHRFWLASEAARALGMDVWEACFDRLQRGDRHQWHAVLETPDQERFERALSLAEATLPLARIATGAEDVMMFGTEYLPHSELLFVVQALQSHAGRGWRLIEAALRSPVTANRAQAARTLAAWPREAWPAAAEAALRSAESVEPNEDTRVLMLEALGGGAEAAG